MTLTEPQDEFERLTTEVDGFSGSDSDQDEADWYNDILGRGPGDPDVHGYPGEGDNDD